jgi:hypothetical protein
MNEHSRFLPQATSIFQEEQGVALITALMILVLLTIVGVASTTISNTETKIATNQALYLQSLYQAEGATQEVIERMSQAGFDPEAFSWIMSTSEYSSAMATDSELWGDEIEGTSKKPDASVLDSPALNTTLLVGIDKIDPELELDMPVRYYFTIYGRCEPLRGGSTTVEIGYIEKF